MKHLFWRVFLIIFSCFLVAQNYSQTFATEFATATIRPERTKVSTSPLPVLITASVSDNLVTEDEVQLVVSSLWSLSAVAGNYTVSTSNLPSGTTAWPGIATATDKSGQTLTFPSGNLSAGTTYGFYITGGITSNPSTAGNSSSYIWQLKTRQGGTQQSSIDVVVPIVSNDQIVVSGVVEPPLSDFSAVLSTLDDTTQLAQDTEVTYTITYGTTYDFATPITLVADWTLGTIDGEITPSVAVLEYVAGSATNAYNSTAPVINLNDQTITWEISSLPGDTTDQTVSFTLKTSDVYTGSTLVSAEVNAKITEPVVTVESTSEVTYLYVAPPTPVPTATPTTTTQTTASSATPTPTPSPASPLRFVNYSLVSVSDTSVELFVELSEPGTVTARFGTLPDARTITVSSNSLRRTHVLLFDNLSPGTQYSLVLEAKSGETHIFSEQLQFFTATSSATLSPTLFTFLAFGGHVFTSDTLQESSLLVPMNTSFEILLSLENDTEMKMTTVFLEKIDDSEVTGVLGKIVYAAQLTRTQNNLWSGTITTPAEAGLYKVTAVIESYTGGKETISLGTFFVSKPIGIFDAKSGKPIERARVLIKKYDERLRLFQFTNQMITNNVGVLEGVFSSGKYQIEVHALGYASQVGSFDTSQLQEFPQLYLQGEQFPFIDSIKYHIETITLKIQRVREIFQKEANSRASLSSLTLLTLLISTPLTLLGFFARSHFSLRTFLHAFKHHTAFIGNAKKNTYVTGHIVNSMTGRPLSFAVIHVLDVEGVMRNSMQAHKNGSFALPISAVEISEIMIVAPGFAPKIIDITQYIISGNQLEVQLEKEETQSNFLGKLLFFCKEFLNSALELNIVLSLITALLFTFVYQKMYAVPFLIVSLFNLVLYIQSQMSDYLHSRYLLSKK